jgi:hypothetical protein
MKLIDKLLVIFLMLVVLISCDPSDPDDPSFISENCDSNGNLVSMDGIMGCQWVGVSSEGTSENNIVYGIAYIFADEDYLSEIFVGTTAVSVEMIFEDNDFNRPTFAQVIMNDYIHDCVDGFGEIFEVSPDDVTINQGGYDGSGSFDFEIDCNGTSISISGDFSVKR